MVVAEAVDEDCRMQMQEKDAETGGLRGRPVTVRQCLGMLLPTRPQMLPLTRTDRKLEYARRG
jgi:hypothetical protein